MVYSMRNVPPASAGRSHRAGCDSTAECLQSWVERPVTPDGVKKWRKSKYDEPGMRVIHPGLQGDVVDRERVFGGLKVESEHVVDAWSHDDSAFCVAKNEQREGVYESRRREPLGKSYVRGHILPAKIRGNPNFEFGKTLTTGGDATVKDLIYATKSADHESKEESEDAIRHLYVKSHGSYEVGEQKRRNYDWKGKDLYTHRFGVGAGSQKAFNGLAPGAKAALADFDEAPAVTSQRLQHFRCLQDKLGKPRHLGLGAANSSSSLPGPVFGKKSLRAQDDWDARQCIQGDFTQESLEPDRDLGNNSNLAGYHNTTATCDDEDRTFGVPTIRSDIPKYAKRSVADTQNYGDDATAQVLLHPSLLTSMGLDEREFNQPRTKTDLIDLIGDTYLLKNADFDTLFHQACDLTSYLNSSPPNNTASLKAFKHVLIDANT